MKNLLTAVALSLAATAVAPSVSFAQPAGVSAAFGNTILSIYPDGRSQKVWLAPDGSWTGQSRRGNPLAGKWTMKGAAICLRQTSPPTLPVSFCQTFPSDPEAGVSAKDMAGTPITLKLVKGHTTG